MKPTDVLAYRPSAIGSVEHRSRDLISGLKSGTSTPPSKLFEIASARHLDSVRVEQLRQRMRETEAIYTPSVSNLAAARTIVGRIAMSMMRSKSDRLRKIVDEYSHLADESDLLVSLRGSSLRVGQKALVLSALIGSGKWRDRDSALGDALDSLLNERDWILDILIDIEPDKLTDEVSSQLQVLYKSARDFEDRGVAGWFGKLANFPDRKQAVAVLVRAFGFELSIGGVHAAEGSRLAAVLSELKSLLVFLGLEEQCVNIARIVGGSTTPDQVMNLCISTLDQEWVYGRWMQEEAECHGIDDSAQASLWRALSFFFKLVPDPCFRDPEHREQVSETLSKLVDASEGIRVNGE